MKLLIINGPNLHNIGDREPIIYGKINFAQYLDNLKTKYSQIKIDYKQSNSEFEIINILHESDNNYEGIVLNAGAYSHSSVAIRDAISSIKIPVVLVHISNVYNREKFRHDNSIASVCKGIITGFGIDSYKLAILSFINN
jgi:3-dehydroquinate dehydratase II